MIKTVERFCKEKNYRFGYGNTEAAADDFFKLGGGVFVITKRPRVGYTEGVVVTRGITDEDRAELARRLRVNGSSANVDGSRINVMFRPARPLYSGGAGIHNPTPPPVVVTPYFENFRTVEVGKTSATLAAELVNPDQVPITSMHIFYSVNGGPNEDVEVQGSFSVEIPLEPGAHVIASCAVYYDGGEWVGGVLEFDTLPLDMPTVTTSEATDVTSSGATFGGVISNPDGVAIDSKGFKYHKGSGAWVDVPVEGDDFTARVTGMESDSNYSYRAYVVVGSETIQGDIVSFRTAEKTERETPFYIINKNEDTATVRFIGNGDITRNFEISENGTDWIDSGSIVSREVPPNGRLYIRNTSTNSNKLSFSSNKYYCFHSLGYGLSFGCGGNILSLVNRNFETMDEVGSGCFSKLFSSPHYWEFPKIYFSNAPEMCLFKMFDNYPCASSVVELPAETVGKQAYAELFYAEGFKNGIDNIRIVLKARDISAYNALNNWIKQTRQGQTGTVVCYPELELPALPSGWTREDLVD